MTVNYTTLLGLAKPVSGTESGTWGDTVNTNLTDYLDSAVAGAQIISGTQTAVTLSKTTGASLSQAGLSGITGSSQYQIIRCTGNPSSLLTITAPTTDKTYIIINATSTSQSVKIVGVGPTPTGVTILSGKTSLVAWNGSDFVEVSPNTISGTLPVANGGTGATTLTGVLKGNGTSAFTAASSGTDYSAGTSALATGILKSTTSTGALTIAVAGDFPTLNQNTTGTAATATNVAGGSAGNVHYQTGSGATGFVTNGTTGQVLTSAGSAAPTWSTPAAATKTIVNTAVAYNVTATDLGKIINCTSGTFTVSLTAAATLGSGFVCTIWNTSNTVTDVITINPNAAETIDGMATLVLRRGEGLAIVCDGTNWQTDDKKPMRGYAENFESTDTRPSAGGRQALAIGRISDASGAEAVAIGTAAISSNDNSLSIGLSTTASAKDAAAIGNNSAHQGSQATGAGAMALGGSYASGTDSFAAGIGNNTSSYGATGANGIAIGKQAKVTGTESLSLGYLSVASGATSTVLGGLQSQATGDYSVALGNNAKAAQYGKYAYASGVFGAVGDAQYGQMVLRAATTTTTAVALTSNGAAASTTNQLIVASGQAMAIQGTLIAKQSGSGNMAGWTITGIVSNNGGTMAVSGLALTLIGVDSIVLGVNLPTIAVDNTNKGVTITSGFKAATNIRWVATVNTSEVLYA